MDKRTFKTLMVLFDAETVEILGDAKFAVEVVTELDDMRYFVADDKVWELI